MGVFTLSFLEMDTPLSRYEPAAWKLMNVFVILINISKKHNPEFSNDIFKANIEISRNVNLFKFILIQQQN